MPSSKEPKGGRKPLVLAKGVKNTLEGSGIARAAKGVQRHVVPAGGEKTLCGIDTASWTELVREGGKSVTCPYCAEALKPKAAKPRKAPKQEAAPAVPPAE